MPPKARITGDMVADAAVEVIRRDGAEALNVRAVAAQLGCSTQPVMYHFPTVEELRREAYARADRIHTVSILKAEPGTDPLLGMGLNYIRFARDERNLFRFLFQTGTAPEMELTELLQSGELAPLIAAVREEAGIGEEQAGRVFRILAMFVHGYASLIADHGIKYDEKTAAEDLESAFRGAVAAARIGEDKDR